METVIAVEYVRGVVIQFAHERLERVQGEEEEEEHRNEVANREYAVNKALTKFLAKAKDAAT